MDAHRKAVEKEVYHLLRLVVRSFYPHQCVLIVEALIFHSVLYEDDLLKLTCMHKKVFRSFCNRLVEDRLIIAYTQKEEAANQTGGYYSQYYNNRNSELSSNPNGPNGTSATNQQQNYRWMSRTYYYVHYLEAIDSIKWKIHCLVKQVKDDIGQFNDPQGYVCPTCHAKYSLLDVPSLLSEDRMCFECSVCGDTLIEDDSGLEAQKGQEKLERLMGQLEPIIESLKKIDSMKVEDNNFESSLIKAVPATSTSIALYTISNRINTRRKKGANDKDTEDAARRSQATVHVSITADDEELVRARRKREQRNVKLRQNAMPSWHRESAVGQGSLGVNREESANSVEFTAAEQVVEKLDSSIGVNGGNEAADEVNATDKANDVNEANRDKDVKMEHSEEIKPSLQALESPQLTGTPQPVETPTSVDSNLLNSDTDSTSNSTKMEIKTEQPPATGGSEVSLLEEGSATTEEMDALTAYYAQLRKRQAEEEEEEEDEDEDEDIDEDEFEAFETDDEADGPAEKDNTMDKITGENTEKVTNEKIETKKESADSSDLDEDEIDDAIFDELNE
ncbi:hypothetical protein FOA43_001049 [Brettanomyces nanus]|uniref:HTH TFE/IIEalpha-type domain-containing protein n=1 Tax=Eeniella nana TaxID=13502 RepID=A0A875RXF4_EENNA|nr:uncharacterized protein FOA43_001049 [Brettanomyces nanus]QPG73736.1 hypothetical protein FOA43_001049 [Brettanomyces nanus]